MIRATLAFTAMLLAVSLAPVAAADVAVVEDACQAGESVLQCTVRETIELKDGVQDEVDDYCDAIIGGCPLFAIVAFPVETTDAATLAAVEEACQGGESVVQCARRETVEFVAGIRSEVDDFCDAIIGGCPLYTLISPIGVTSFNAAAACQEGESVVQCASRETNEFVGGVAGEVWDFCDAIVGDCRDIIQRLITSSTAAATAVDEACQDGESVLQCATRETVEFVDGVRGEVDDFCDAIVGNCKIYYLEYIDIGNVDLAAASFDAAACQDGESVVQCATRETRELVDGVADEVWDYCDAIVGNCQFTFTCSDDLCGLIVTTTSTAVEACQAGESVLQCAVRETDEFADGVRQEVDDYCDGMVGGCPLYYLFEIKA